MIDILVALGVRPTQLMIQIVGFLILFGVLAKVLWKPLLGVMESREKEVGDLYKKAEESEHEAEYLKAQYETKIKRIQEEEQNRIAEAVHRGNDMAERIIGDARKAADLETEKAKNAIREETARARMSLRDYTIELSFDLAGRVLKKEISEKAHEDLVKNFLVELDTLEKGKV